MKKLSAFVFVLLLAISFSACGNAQQQAEHIPAQQESGDQFLPVSFSRKGVEGFLQDFLFLAAYDNIPVFFDGEHGVAVGI